MRKLVSFFLTAWVTTACSTSLSSFQPAHVARKGQFQAETGVDVSIPTGPILKTIDAAKDISRLAENQELTQEQSQKVFAAAVNLTLNAPALIYHAGLTYGIAKDWDVSARYAAGEWRVGGRHQWLHQESDGYDLTLGLGISHSGVSFPVGDVLKVIQLTGYSRWNVDIPLVLGQHGKFFRWWAGPHLMAGFAGVDLLLTQPNRVTDASATTSGWYAGARAGFALGYKKLFFAFELTVSQLFSTAALSINSVTTDVDMDSLVIYPAVGLMGEF